MAKLRELYKCSLCGNVLEVAYAGVSTPVCCGKEMDLMEANTVDASQEKHVPVVEDHPECGIMVKVGSVAHPMDENHHIAFIEVLTANRVIRVELKPGDKPEACFCVSKEDVLEVREYCNLHGLWKK